MTSFNVMVFFGGIDGFAIDIGKHIMVLQRLLCFALLWRLVIICVQSTIAFQQLTIRTNAQLYNAL